VCVVCVVCVVCGSCVCVCVSHVKQPCGESSVCVEG